MLDLRSHMLNEELSTRWPNCWPNMFKLKSYHEYLIFSLLRKKSKGFRNGQCQNKHRP